MAFMQRQKNFWNEMLWKPKKPLSLDQLKYHHLTLERNPYVTESNKKLLVETFRSIAEILIWGDQNDSSVFDFFLEKNMQSYFLKILGKEPGRYVVIQLLQTMSILFENIKNETSIYYLLSNNHVNSLIVLKLDFSDEEVLAYYISFLKTLSFKLNRHTIHFFYNEHLRDFPLYTEAIKFFNNPESMVRIAVRTLTLNVYKVEDKNTIEFICNKTAAPYFTNLVWFVGNHVLRLDECLEQKSSHLNRNSLESAVAEHLDHLHYMNDILSLHVASLNEILRDHLLNRLFVPLYVHSLFETAFEVRKEEDTPRVSSKIALFLLSQVFLIISHPVLTTELAFLILTGDQDLKFPSPILKDFDTANESPGRSKHRRNSSRGSIVGFLPPDTSLATSLSRPLRNNASPRPVQRERGQEIDINGDSTNSSKGGSSADSHSVKELTVIPEYNGFVVIESPSEREIAEALAKQKEEEMRNDEEITEDNPEEQCFVDITPVHSIPIKSSVYLESILSAIIPGPNDDSRSLVAIALFYAMIHNESVSKHLLEAFSFKNHRDQKAPYYIQTELIGRLLSVIEASAVGSVRLVTLHLCVALLSHLLYLDFSYTVVNSVPHPPSDQSDAPPASMLSEHHLKKLERAMEEACRRMEKFYRSLGEGEEVFLELFEDEYSNEQKFFLKVNYLLMDAAMLLPATGTPMTGIDFTKRLPCGETEKARKAMRVFFSIRKFCQSMYKEEEMFLPLTPSTTSVVTEDVIDTTNSDLVRCEVITGESSTERFLVVTGSEFILVEPDTTQLGCGIVKFIAFLQDVDISQDPADNLSLRVVAYHRSRSQIKRRPALTAKMTFEDNIRCLATRQNLQRRKDGLRHKKMSIVAEMLGIPPPSSPIRKRDNVSVTDVTTQPISISTNTLEQHHNASSDPSPHKLATTLLKDTSPEPPTETYELGLVDSNGIPVSTRAPSPHAHYVSKNEKVTLSFGHDPFESKVRTLPSKSISYETTEIRHEETDRGFTNDSSFDRASDRTKGVVEKGESYKEQEGDSEREEKGGTSQIELDNNSHTRRQLVDNSTVNSQNSTSNNTIDDDPISGNSNIVNEVSNVRSDSSDHVEDELLSLTMNEEEMTADTETSRVTLSETNDDTSNGVSRRLVEQKYEEQSEEDDELSKQYCTEEPTERTVTPINNDDSKEYINESDYNNCNNDVVLQYNTATTNNQLSGDDSHD